MTTKSTEEQSEARNTEEQIENAEISPLDGEVEDQEDDVEDDGCGDDPDDWVRHCGEQMTFDVMHREVVIGRMIVRCGADDYGDLWGLDVEASPEIQLRLVEAVRDYEPRADCEPLGETRVVTGPDGSGTVSGVYPRYVRSLLDLEDTHTIEDGE